MAELIVELTESRSEIVFEALPVDDPQVRQPDITRARQLLGWEPEIEIREGLRRTIEHYAKVLGAPARDELPRPRTSRRSARRSTSTTRAASGRRSRSSSTRSSSSGSAGTRIRGLPIRANPELGTGRFRVVCAREEGEPGESVEAVAEQTVPAEPIKVG